MVDNVFGKTTCYATPFMLLVQDKTLDSIQCTFSTLLFEFIVYRILSESNRKASSVKDMSVYLLSFTGMTALI